MRPTTGGPLNPKAINQLPGRWVYEPKVNGWRALIHVPTLTVYNRHGELLSITQEFSEALDFLWENAPADMEWADCEMLSRRHAVDKGKIILLDEIIDRPYWWRLGRLSRTWEVRRVLPIKMRPAESPDTSAPVWVQPAVDDPFESWVQLQEANTIYGCDYYEGLVAKRWDSPYETQLVSASRTTPYWIKYRFDQYKEL